MDDKIDRMERLARLKAEGALSEQEYADAKAKLLAESDPRPSSGARTPPPEQPIDEAQLAPIWRQRFQLIDAHGMPNSKPYNEAFKSLPITERARLAMSPLAFLLGPFYFAYLGLWRPALSLLGASLVFAILTNGLDLPPSIDRLMWVFPATAYAWTCIPLYYLRVRRGLHSWNPLIWWRA